METSQSEAYVDKLLTLIHQIVTELHPHFNRDRVTLEDDFEKDLGLDSLSRVELITRIEEAFNKALPQEIIYEAQTPKALLDALFEADAAPIMDSYLKKSELRLEKTHALPHKAQTLVQALQWHLQQHPKRPHIQLYADEGEGEIITYEKLYHEALKVAHSLQQHGIEPAQSVAIMLPTQSGYFYAFYGILLAGAVPVPIYPPARASQLQEHVERHTKILTNAKVKLLITIPQAQTIAGILRSYVPSIETVVTVAQLLKSQPSPTLPPLDPSDTAFIQYTSGSTGDPKGVVLSHANLLANIRAMGQAVEATSEDVFVSWLPLYHDMGLIGAWLGSLYHATLFVVMSPLDFLAKPQRWLWAIHRYGGTLSASPNFGYEYTMHRLKQEDIAGLDLSSWRGAFNGAEAVSPVTLQNFCDFFGPYGFKPEAMAPVYGLAESSVGVTFPPMGRGAVIDRIDRKRFMRSKVAKACQEEDPNPLQFLSCGVPIIGHQVRVVDQTGHELPDRHEGALQFSGPSSTSGYFDNPQKSRELFDGEWLNTGDRAYIAEGELYLTGRIKDIIIKAGRNIYPDELEKAVGEIEGIRKGCVAVFASVDKQSGTERLIVLAESKITQEEERARLHEKINTLAKDLLGQPPDEIVLAQPGAVLKTSSGKIRRAASRELFEKRGGKTQSQSLIWQLTRLTLKSIIPRTRRIVRLTKRRLFALYSWSVFVFFTVLVWLAIMLLPTLKLRWMMMRFCAKSAALFTATPIRVNGAENLPQKDALTVIVANHSSYLDSFVLTLALPRPVRFVAKAELSKIWFSRIPLLKIKTQFVERFDTGKSVDDSQRLHDMMYKGAPLLFFPEGTFTRIPGLKPFHLGAFNVAAASDAAVIPIAVKGTRSILRPGSWFPQHGAIEITIGTPICSQAPKDTDLWHKSLELSQKSRAFILQHCAEPDLAYDLSNPLKS